MSEDHFIDTAELTPDDAHGSILRDRDSVLHDVLTGNKIEPSTMFAIMGALVSVVQAGDTQLWRTRVLKEFAQLRSEIHQLRQQIAALGVHISNEIDRGFLENDFRQLMATIKAYHFNYPAYTDQEYARQHANQLLMAHELRSLELLEHNDFSTVLQVSAGFATHHDLMHFANRPLIVREQVYKGYQEFFAASLDPARAGSWTARKDQLEQEKQSALQAWQTHRPPTGTTTRRVDHRGYGFDVHMGTVFENDTWRRTSMNAYVASVPPPPRDYDRFDRIEKSVGAHVAEPGRCWGVGGPSCSQIHGAMEQFDREIDSFNSTHRNLRGTLDQVRVNLVRATEGFEVATKFNEMLEALVANPEAYPPNSPGA